LQHTIRVFARADDQYAKVNASKPYIDVTWPKVHGQKPTKVHTATDHRMYNPSLDGTYHSWDHTFPTNHIRNEAEFNTLMQDIWTGSAAAPDLVPIVSRALKDKNSHIVSQHPEYLNKGIEPAITDEIAFTQYWEAMEDLRWTYPFSIQYVRTLTGKYSLEITIRDPHFILDISNTLARIMGFNLPEDTWLRFGQIGTYFYPNISFNSGGADPDILNIYTSITEPVFVGHTIAPLLKTIPIGSAGYKQKVYSKEFQNLNYMKVLRQSIQEIEVEIRDSTGELAPFDLGKVYLRLHFRPRKV
jgi:hypothetical protein